MNPLVIESSAETPEVILDKKTNTFIFKGKSLPENPISFYAPILDWLENYSNDPNSSTEVDFKMIYFNTSSSKILLDVMKKFEIIKKSGHEVFINWRYREDDEEMLEAGEIYSERVCIPFNLITDETEY
ncbi:MAG: DUF1987 domain-containing protein [Salinivirgaceae bacterium]|nr:DUF1987 domain-containing protein [Salinivirgaceae bacterium]